MTVKNFSIGDIVNESWAIIKKHIWIFAATILGFYLVYLLIYFLIGGMGAASGFAVSRNESLSDALGAMFSVGAIISFFLMSLVGAIFYLGFYRMALDAADGKNPDLSAFSAITSVKKILNLFIANILFAIAFYIGLILCIVPGLLIIARLQYYIFFIVEQDCNAVEALSNSWNVTKGNTLNLTLLLFVFALINLLGALCCGVGLLVTTPMTIIGFALIYRLFNGGGPETVEFEDISEKNEPVV